MLGMHTKICLGHAGITANMTSNVQVYYARGPFCDLCTEIPFLGNDEGAGMKPNVQEYYTRKRCVVCM